MCWDACWSTEGDGLDTGVVRLFAVTIITVGHRTFGGAVLANCPIIWLINRTQWPTANGTHVLVKIKKQMNVEVHLKGGRYRRALSKIGNASSTKSIKR